MLSRIELVNSIVALLSIDFHALETDVRKEQQLRQKTGASASDSVLVPNMTFGHRCSICCKLFFALRTYLISALSLRKAMQLENCALSCQSC